MTRMTKTNSPVSMSLGGPLRPALDRRRLLGWAGGLGVSVAASFLGASAMVSAQTDHTMPPGGTGITPEPLGGGLPAAAPGYLLGLTRLTFAPGATLNAHTHPGASVLFIESGSLIYSLWEGTATATRAATGSATPVAEPLSPGDITLNAGDSLFEDADVIHTALNDGSEPTVILISGLLLADEPVSTYLEATPAP